MTYQQAYHINRKQKRNFFLAFFLGAVSDIRVHQDEPVCSGIRAKLVLLPTLLHTEVIPDNYGTNI